MGMMAAAAVFTIASPLMSGRGDVAPFLVSAVAVALLAGLVGRAVDHLSDRLGAGAVGVLQSALGNLPELFICVFALRAGLTEVVTSALIGSILGNLLLVSKDREQWDPALRARLPDSATTCFWRSIAAAPWPANTYHDLGIALLGDYQIDVAWLAFDLGRAIDPTWKGGVMASIADAEQRLEHNLPDFF